LKYNKQATFSTYVSTSETLTVLSWEKKMCCDWKLKPLKQQAKKNGLQRHEHDDIGMTVHVKYSFLESC